MDDIHIQSKGHRSTDMGEATYIRVYTPDYRKLTWTEVWAAFADTFPGQWAVQVFPPKDELIDEQNIYHLFVLEDRPRGLSIRG